MNIIQAQYKGVNLIGGYQFWSNPVLFETEAAIYMVLLRPTLLDLIRLVRKYGVDRLAQDNDLLLQSGCMSGLTHARNVHRLNTIGKAK